MDSRLNSPSSRDPRILSPGLPNHQASVANPDPEEDPYSQSESPSDFKPAQLQNQQNEDTMARRRSISSRSPVTHEEYGNLPLDQEELAQAFIETLRRVSRPRPAYAQSGNGYEQSIPPPPPPPPPPMPIHLPGTPIRGNQYAGVRQDRAYGHSYTMSNASVPRMAANDPYRHDYAASVSSKRTVYTNRQPTTPR